MQKCPDSIIGVSVDGFVFYEAQWTTVTKTISVNISQNMKCLEDANRAYLNGRKPTFKMSDNGAMLPVLDK